MTSLCHLNPDWFIEALETADQFLTDSSSSSTHRACVLHTLAHCSLSEECILTLLRSNIITLIFSSLINSLKALDSIKSESYDSILDAICSDIAFLTSIAFGHTIAQEWLIQRENAFFWPDLLRCFNEPCPFNDDDLSFCQHTVQQFFAVCIKFNVQGKQLLTDLLVNSLLGRYSLEPVVDITGPYDYRLTPFTRTLIIDHLLGPEAVHVIVKIDLSLLVSNHQRTKMSSLIPTYDSPHYHPSYPITDNYFYLKLSSENTLGRILSLIGLEESSTKAKDNKTELSKQKKTLDSSKAKGPVPEGSKPFINIFDCNFLKGSDYQSTPKPINGIIFTASDNPTLFLPSNTKMKQVPKANNDYSCSQTRTLVISKDKGDLMIPSDTHTYTPMLDIFADSVGMSALAQIISHLYPSSWPPTNNALDSQIVYDISQVPKLTRASFLPPHSYVMLCLGLKLKQYGKQMCCTNIIGNVWHLIRGSLGASEECEEIIKWNTCNIS